MRIDLWNEVSSNGQKPSFETFLLEGEEVRPLIVICPGGSYTHYGTREQETVARKFNDFGFHAAVLQYRIAPTRFPDPTLDLLRTIKLVRKNAAQWHVDPERIAALGFSAGGHLALSAGVYHGKLECRAGDEADQYSSRPDALVLCYAAIGTKGEFANPGIARTLSGGETEEETLNATSLDELVTSELPPAFIWQSATDGAVNYRNPLQLAEKIWGFGGKCSLHIFPDGPHGRGLSEDYPDMKQWPELAAQFLKTTCGF